MKQQGAGDARDRGLFKEVRLARDQPQADGSVVQRLPFGKPVRDEFTEMAHHLDLGGVGLHQGRNGIARPLDTHRSVEPFVRCGSRVHRLDLRSYPRARTLCRDASRSSRARFRSTPHA